MSLRPDVHDDGLTDAVADQLGSRVGIDGLLADLGRDGREARWAPVPGRTGSETDATGFAWDDADGSTRQWWPQGLTTWADAAALGSAVGDRRVLLSGWYAKQGGRSDRATRISVVDLDAAPDGPRYAHVLLVEPYRERWSGAVRHRLVRVHAGGLVWCGDRLLVADTRHGARVFDPGDVVRLPADTDLGHDASHVLPQRGTWWAHAGRGTRPLRWSFLSLDRTTPGELSLVAGEYDRNGAAARVARWRLDPTTGLPDRAEPEDVVHTDIASMQGATRVDGRYVVSSSHGDSRRGHLWTGPAGGPYTQHAEALPIGPEDLSYDPDTRRVWTQTEYPGRRYVLNLPLPGDPLH